MQTNNNKSLWKGQLITWYLPPGHPRKSYKGKADFTHWQKSGSLFMHNTHFYIWKCSDSIRPAYASFHQKNVVLVPPPPSLQSKSTQPMPWWNLSPDHPAASYRPRCDRAQTGRVIKTCGQAVLPAAASCNSLSHPFHKWMAIINILPTSI